MKTNRLVPALLLAGILAGAVTATVLQTRSAEAARNSGGTYSLPSSYNPVVSGTTITSTWANTTLNDMATEVTNSLDRQGRGAMLAHLQSSSGTVAAPGLTFSSDPASGLYLAGAANPAMSVSSSQKQSWTTTGTQITGRLGLNQAASTFSVEEADPASGNVGMKIGSSFPLFVRTNFPGLGFNLYYDGTNTKYGSTNVGADMELDTSGNLVFRTTPSGSSGTNATVTERLRVSPTGIRIGGSGGTDISASYGATYVINFGALTAGTNALSAQTLTGVSLGGVCMVSTDGNVGNNVISCYVSAANTIQIKAACIANNTLSSGNYRVRVFQP